VKPIGVMRWLVRLITPPGGLVLDPFAGSGTTGIAAALEGMRFCGIEQDPAYADIARRRIAYWMQHGPEALEVVRRGQRAERRRAEVEDDGQLGLL
jgi:site-specific DNA-methyltransferase (adenine-specific)